MKKPGVPDDLDQLISRLFPTLSMPMFGGGPYVIYCITELPGTAECTTAPKQE